MEGDYLRQILVVVVVPKSTYKNCSNTSNTVFVINLGFEYKSFSRERLILTVTCAFKIQNEHD